MPNIIRGKYDPSVSAISIDYGSHIFDDASSTVFHEQTHYYLSLYTNHGAVLNILAEITHRNKKLVVDLNLVKKTISELHDACYFVQEGFAHLLQAKRLMKDGGKTAVDALLENIPNKPKIALTDLLFTLNFTQEQFDQFTGKISDLAMNTTLHLEAAKKQGIILDQNKLKEHLVEENNNPNSRLKKLRYAVERDPSILQLNSADICKKVGISYQDSMSNQEKADLINAITAFTDQPTALSEKDITPLQNSDEIFTSSYEGMVIRDANLERLARTDLPKDVLHSNLAKLRTIFIYNNPESPQPSGHFGYYAFLAPKVVANLSMSISESTSVLNMGASITKIVDTHSFDYKQLTIKKERDFVNPDVIWYKNFNDFNLILDLVNNLQCHVYWTSVAFTEKDHHLFYFFLFKDFPRILHVLPCFPFVKNKITRAEFEPIDFQELAKGREAHINNFMHDMMGLPYQFDVVAMSQDPKAFLEIAKRKLADGLSRNDRCLCGSTKKWKHCHGFGK